MSKQKRKTVDHSKTTYPRPDRREPVDTLKEQLNDFKDENNQEYHEVKETKNEIS
jgi:antitoxin component of MazEF toxin-antitoxin module